VVSLRLSRSPNLAWALTIPLVLLAAIATTVAARWGGGGPVLSPWPLVLLYLAIFLAAEATNLSVELRRQAARILIAEVPLIVALFYLSPLSVVAVRVLAHLGGHMLRRTEPVKIAFNLASIGCSTAVVALIVATHRPQLANIAPSSWHDAPGAWVVLLGAAVVGLLISAVNIFGVIWLVQGPMTISDLSQAAGPGIILGAVNATIGLVVLLVVRATPWSVLLLTVVTGALVAVYQTYAQFVRQHRRLSDIHDLTKAISETSYDGTLIDVLLKRVRQLLRAEYATLWLPAAGRYPETLLSARADDKGLLDVSGTPSSLRQLAVQTGVTVAAGVKLGDDNLRQVLRASNTKDAIVVPLRSGGAVIGSLEVAGRMSDVQHFTPDDVRLVETLAAQASVAVENNRLVDRLRFDAYHDALTGLPNRRRMLASLEEAVKIRAPGEVVAVMIFDSDGLRDVNDSLGHAAGDQLLTEFARRLRDLCPPAALVGRVGGDGFAVTIRIESADAALVFATDIRQALTHPMEFGPLSLDVGAAVGISVHPDHGSDPATLLQRADVAKHAAKAQSSGVLLFDPSLESRSVRRLGLAADLRRALDNDALQIHFQPKVSLRTRELVGVECLARWDHPVHGAVAPEDFLAVAEHTGQLGRLTEFLLRQGLRRAHDWSESGHPLPISVNLSPRTVVDHDFPARLRELLAEHSVAPELLTLEITEDGMIADKERPIPALRRLDDMGVRISVDDFGTGYSSLSYLRRLPVDEVKIDRSFVQGMATDAGDLAIVRAIVELCRHLGLVVVAEGVESELTLSLLDEMGCDIGQGFLFSRPLPYDRLEAWLTARTDTDNGAPGAIRRLRAVQ
jgi:diguanylate cyclase (GGDEF)-like protein